MACPLGNDFYLVDLDSGTNIRVGRQVNDRRQISLNDLPSSISRLADNDRLLRSDKIETRVRGLKHVDWHRY